MPQNIKIVVDVFEKYGVPYEIVGDGILVLK